MGKSIPIQTGSDGKKYITVTVKCSHCGGSGIRTELGARKGFSIVCASCDGSGGMEQTIELFDGKIEIRDDIRFVHDVIRDRSPKRYRRYIRGKITK